MSLTHVHLSLIDSPVPDRSHRPSVHNCGDAVLTGSVVDLRKLPSVEADCSRQP